MQCENCEIITGGVEQTEERNGVGFPLPRLGCLGERRKLMLVPNTNDFTAMIKNLGIRQETPREIRYPNVTFLNNIVQVLWKCGAGLLRQGTRQDFICCCWLPLY